MAKRKVGLHKEISSIFEGVPLPKHNGDNKSQSTTTVERPGYIPPMMKEPAQPPPQFTAHSKPLSKPLSKPPVEPKPRETVELSESPAPWWHKFDGIKKVLQKIP